VTGRIAGGRQQAAQRSAASRVVRAGHIDGQHVREQMDLLHGERLCGGAPTDSLILHSKQAGGNDERTL